MKIESVEISGMHKVASKRYEFNDSLTYLIGTNGSGKSTILQAIQLGLLGYIPGTAKTGQKIFEHANSNKMQVKVNFDDGSWIHRTWMRSGDSVKSDVETSSGLSIDLSDIELPVFNFGEFKDMTANKLKDWFIDFLPNSEFAVDWPSLLTGRANLSGLFDVELAMKDVIEFIDGCGESGVSLIKALNEHMKLLLSFYKKEAESLQSSVNSLIYYQDLGLEVFNEDEAKQEMKDILEKRSALSLFRSQMGKYKEDCEKLKSIGFTEDGRSEMLDLDKTIIDIQNLIAAEEERLSSLNARYEVLRSQRYDKTQLCIGNVCPYSKKECISLSSMSAEAEREIESLTQQISDLESAMSQCNQIRQSRNADLRTAETRRKYLEGQMSRAEYLRSSVENPPTCAVVESEEQLVSRYEYLQDMITKKAANDNYNKLIDTVTRDKYRTENCIEVLKCWIKFTDANGLQTQVMTKQFDSLRDNLSRYLSDMFRDPVTCHFNIEEKANSFSFGVLRGDKYIPFDLLSSGEKCLYTLGLMMCISDMSDSNVKVILVDDILDHLDDSNAEGMFDAISNVKSCQFIFAGVKKAPSSVYTIEP